MKEHATMIHTPLRRELIDYVTLWSYTRESVEDLKALVTLAADGTQYPKTGLESATANGPQRHCSEVPSASLEAMSMSWSVCVVWFEMKSPLSP